MNEVIIDNVSVVEIDGEFFVTSLQVAEHFEKEHFHVLRDIENLQVSEKFRQSNFGLSNYKSSQGKKMPMVNMTRDGFTILAMGFTGSKSMEWKERYIFAFNSMEKELTRIGGAGWLQKRIEGKLYRRPLTDAIQRFIEYAVAQGSETYKKAPHLAYIQFTKMEYKALFLLSKSIPGLRDKLSMMALNSLQQAEYIVRKCIEDCMATNMFYKDIYQEAKKRVESFSALVGPADAITAAIDQGKINPFSLPEEEVE